jgi:hypothetical protein
MNRGRGIRASVVVVALVAPQFMKNDVDASKNPGETLGRVVQLASNDGRYEAANRPTTFINTGAGYLPVDNRDVHVESGDVIRFSSPLGEVVSSTELDQSRAVRQGVKAVEVIPNRMLTVVPVLFDGSRWNSADQAIADQVAASTKSWWNMMSARQETLSVRFTDVLNLESVAKNCDINVIRTQVLKKVSSLNLLKSSQHVMATFVGHQTCPFAGLGEIGRWSDAAFTWTYTDHVVHSVGVWIHELGHNLGLPHANSCLNNFPMTYLRTCEDVEYGNTVAVMGGGGTNSPLTPTELEEVGWLKPENAYTWDFQTRTIDINKFEATESGITAIKIPAISPQLGDNDIWLQFSAQKKMYYATYPYSEVASGVVITFEPSEVYRESAIMRKGVLGSIASLAYLCDITPKQDKFTERDDLSDPRLQVGQTWVEPRGRYSIRFNVASADKATMTLTALTPTLNAPAAVSAIQDPDGRTAIKFSADFAQVPAGTNEPIEWVADIAEDPSKKCRGNALMTSCLITGLSRGAVYTPRMAYASGAVVSTATAGQQVLIQNTSPMILVATKSTSDSVNVSVSIDNGGADVSLPVLVLLSDGQQCQIQDASGGSCEFSNLARFRGYQVTATATNAVGTRTSHVSFSTLSDMPDAPVLSAAFEGRDLRISIGTTSRDDTNVQYFNAYCRANTRTHNFYNLRRAINSSFTDVLIPAAKGKLVHCWIDGTSTGTKRIETGLGSILQVTKKGRILLPRMAARLVASSSRTGVVVVQWKAKDVNGRISYVEVKTSAKRCKIPTRTATKCTVSGLVSGSVFVAVLYVRGPSGEARHRVTVVVK